jgi:polyhydroxybutyrate depolymerase
MGTLRPMRHAILLATLLLVPAAPTEGAQLSTVPMSPPASSCRDLIPGEYPSEVDVDGLPREVLVHVPPAASEPGARLPLVIAYHGYSAYAWQLAESARLGPVADELGFVVAYPQGLPDGPWPPDWYFPGAPDEPPQGVDEIRFVEVLLELAAAEGCIDTDRVFVMGHSKGGGMAEAAACALADRLAGAVLVSAIQLGIPCAPATPIPVVALHALDDAVLPYAGGHIPGTPSSYPDVLPVEQGIGAWATRNRCTSGPVVSPRPDGGADLAWEGCAAPVILHRLASGGHDIPDLAAVVVREMVLDTADGGDGPAHSPR